MVYNNGYLFPIFLAILIVITNMVFSQKLMYDRRFKNPISNRLYALSFLKPFIWFIDSSEEGPKAKRIENLIKRAEMEHILNYRVYMTFQTILFFSILVFYSILLLFLDNIMDILDFLFRIENSTGNTNLETRLFIGIILFAVMLIPKQYLKRMAKKKEYYFTQVLPVVQLSVVLMLRAKRSINDILYTLGHNKTIYQSIFQKAHRIYLRNKSQCWEFLHQNFKGTGFEDTVDVLAEMDRYSRTETIQVLENNMEFLVQRSSEQKRKGASFGNLFSQFSMAIPFGGVILLAAIPFAMYIFQMMQDGVSF